MCKAMEEMWEKAVQEGKEETRIENAKRMLKDGRLSPELIAEYSGLPLEKVVKLKKARGPAGRGRAGNR